MMLDMMEFSDTNRYRLNSALKANVLLFEENLLLS